MATRKKRKLAALNKENCEKHPRSNLAQNSNVPRSQEDYITQVSEEIEGRVTKKLSKEFSRTENRILSALARLDDFLMNPLIQVHSGITPEMSRNAFSTKQGTNEDDSQSDPDPEAGIFGNQMTQNSGPEDDRDSLEYTYNTRPVERDKVRQPKIIQTKTYRKVDPNRVWIVGLFMPVLLVLCQLVILRHILENMKAKSSSRMAIPDVFSPDVCQLRSRCSVTFLNVKFFLPSCSKFAVECY